MTPLKFYELDQKEQECILAEAIKVAERLNFHFRYELFQVEGMYIQVKTSLYYNLKKECYAFDNIALIDPYLSEMPLWLELSK